MNRILFFLTVAGFSATSAKSQLAIDNTIFFIGPGALVTAQGDVTSNVDIQGAGLLLIKGNTLQNINMEGFTIPNLEIDNINNVNLTGKAMVGANLLFTNGNVQLNTFDLRMASAATITGITSARFVITNGTGRLVKNSLGPATSPFIFPVGFSASEFNPLTITNNGTTDDIGVRCTQNVLTQGLTGTPITQDFANNSWIISEAIEGGSNFTMTGEWTAGDELSNFNRFKSGIARYKSGTDWDLPAINIASAPGSDPYTCSRTNITSTGVFGIADLQNVNAARLNLKVFLQGPYNSANGLMSDWLRDDPSTSGIDPVIPTTQPYNASLNAKFARAGVYDGTATVNETVNPTVFNTTGNDAIVDWVYISTVDTLNPAIKFQTRAALLQRDGDIVDTDGISPVVMPIDNDGNYQFLVSHRNHLSIRTPAAYSLADNAIFNYDFTTAQSKAFQNSVITTNTAMAQFGNVFMMMAGNADMDDFVRAILQVQPLIPSDADYIREVILNGNPNATVTGYSVADLNMDRSVRAASKILPPIPSDIAFILGMVLGGQPNAIRQEHK